MEKMNEFLDEANHLKSNRARQQVAPVESVKKNNTSLLNDELGSIQYNSKNVVRLDLAHLENNRIVAHNKLNPASWIFDSLRTQVLQKMAEHEWRTIAIVSPTPATGKTLVAINLAISIAQQTQNTAMIVDFDLRKPRVAQYLGIKHEKSINDFLSGKAELSEIIINPGLPRLTVLPTNNPVLQSSEILSSSGIKKLIIELKERYDSRIVIFDLPPILNADDAMVVLPQVDCVLLVIGDGMHTQPEVKETMRLLSRSNILGVVVNKGEVDYQVRHYD